MSSTKRYGNSLGADACRNSSNSRERCAGREIWTNCGGGERIEEESWMTVTLKLSSEQEHRLRVGGAGQDAQTVREILLRAVEPRVEDFLNPSGDRPKATTLPALLEKIAAGFRDAPALPDEAVSRAGIYADHL